MPRRLRWKRDVRRGCLCRISDDQHRPDGLGGPDPSKNGRVFLIDTFLENEQLADSVNHLLVVGFYLINVGYVTLALKYGSRPADLAGAIETLSTKVGLVLLVLGVMHFFNLYVFSRCGGGRCSGTQKPPVLPERFIEPVQSWNH